MQAAPNTTQEKHGDIMLSLTSLIEYALTVFGLKVEGDDFQEQVAVGLSLRIQFDVERSICSCKHYHILQCIVIGENFDITCGGEEILYAEDVDEY